MTVMTGVQRRLRMVDPVVKQVLEVINTKHLSVDRPTKVSVRYSIRFAAVCEKSTRLRECMKKTECC